jgi:hypothetical protein
MSRISAGRSSHQSTVSIRGPPKYQPSSRSASAFAVLRFTQFILSDQTYQRKVRSALFQMDPRLREGDIAVNELGARFLSELGMTRRQGRIVNRQSSIGNDSITRSLNHSIVVHRFTA